MSVPQGATLSVLLVEDHPDSAEMMQLMLEPRGFAVQIAGSGEEALERANAERYDVVVCDVGLPGLSGLEVASALRADPRTRELKLVAMSGFGTEADRAQCERAGFDAYLTKPVDIDALVVALRST